MTVTVRRAGESDAARLAALAALTFPLACPPDAPAASIAAFVAENLGEDAFRRYLAASDRELYLAETAPDASAETAAGTGRAPGTGTGTGDADDAAGEPVGYTMLVHADPSDEEVVAALTAHPTTELSKFYVHPAHHGAGVAAALMRASVDAARADGSAAIWLGVNQQNGRANAFYEKNGFARVGVKHFRLGDRIEDDFVRERVFDGTSIGGS